MHFTWQSRQPMGCAAKQQARCCFVQSRALAASGAACCAPRAAGLTHLVMGELVMEETWMLAGMSDAARAPGLSLVIMICAGAGAHAGAAA
jgi:hypothetical protein